MLDNLIQDHDIGDLDCPNCDAQYGYCSCGGIIHCEIQSPRLFSRATAMIMECDTCDEYEVE